MSKHLLILGFAFAFIGRSHGQTTPPILMVSEYKPGIYRTYTEFLQNSPSIDERFSYRTYSSAKKIKNGQGVYYMSLLDSAVRRRDQKKFWGFSDGKNIFINEVLISGELSFRKLQGLGRYCYLYASPPSGNVPVVTGGLVAVAPNVPRMIDGDEPYVLNVNNGKFFLLNHKTLLTILERDSELLRDYKADEERRREDTFIDYIARYNRTHLHEANAELWFDREVAIYRPSKKEIVEPLQLTINDTLKLSIGPNSVQRLKLQGEKAKICNGKECSDIQLSRKEANYILTSQRKPGSTTIRKVEVEVGEYEIAAIQKEALE